jgi:DNA-binding response OmpR family regulator
MKPAKILLVDDEVAFVNNIAKLISKRGFEVKTVYNGESAIQALNEVDFDRPGLKNAGVGRPLHFEADQD